MYKVGQIAKLIGITPVTLRYYEKIGLITQAVRHANGYRYYPSQVIHQLKFIQNAKAAGFTLTEIQELLALKNSNGANSKSIKDLINKKILDVNEKIESLEKVKVLLINLNQSCKRVVPLQDCPIIKKLDSPQK